MSRHPKGCGTRQQRDRKPRLGSGVGYDDVLVEGKVLCRCRVCGRDIEPRAWPPHGSSADPHGAPATTSPAIPA